MVKRDSHSKNCISFDLYSDFGFFRKPDINKIGLTYNIPPKPSLLGLLGSILGMSGLGRQYELEQELEEGRDTQDIFPEYYVKLQHLRIGIEPADGFPFNKIINTYNSRNSYFSNVNENTIIHEQIMIRPRYTVYVYDSSEDGQIKEVTRRLNDNNPVFTPYLGKNEFIACFENVKSVTAKPLQGVADFISSVFLINKTDSNQKKHPSRNHSNSRSVELKNLPTGYRFFEDYPIKYGDDMHYELQTLQYSEKPSKDVDLKKGGLFAIGDKVIYLF